MAGDDDHDGEHGEGALCLHCRIIDAISKWREDEIAAGINHDDMAGDGTEILAALCMIVVDVLLQDRSDGAFADFKENSQRVMATMLALYNEEAPQGRKLGIRFLQKAEAGAFLGTKKHLH